MMKGNVLVVELIRAAIGASALPVNDPLKHNTTGDAEPTQSRFHRNGKMVLW
jgi:hypothetical protein